MDNYRIRRNKRKQRISLLTNIFFCIIALAGLTGCIVLLLQNYYLQHKSEEAMARLQEAEAKQENYIYSEADMETFTKEAAANAGEEQRTQLLNEMKTQMSNGGSTVAMLRNFFPEDIVVFSDSQYYFFPVSETLKKHNYTYDNFKLQENDQVVYVDETDAVISKKGIDVSRYQDKINWSKVANDGVEYAFIRAGIRGSTEGKLVKDENFIHNVEGALDHDIDVGVYFYTQAMSEEEAIEEAEFVLDLIEPYDITYPVVLDVEEVTSKNARTSEMTKEDYTKACIAFLETIKKAGYTPMIYGNLKTFMIMLDMEQLESYDKWFAYYNTPVYFPYEFTIWQYTSEGTISGIDGEVDLNVSMKDYAAND